MVINKCGLPPTLFSLVLLFDCCRFGSDPNWLKILTSDNVRSGVTRDVTATAGIEPVDSLQSWKAIVLDSFTTYGHVWK